MAEIWQLSATQIAQAVRSGAFSAREVTEAHLERLGTVNPAINAVVQECPEEALAAAQKVDNKIAKGEDAGILCGVPVTIKVNIDQKGYATTNGLKMFENLVADHDSPVVSNIKKAGGIIVGRTNTPAFSLRWFTNNNLHGQTLNPRNAAITPGGSSGGAAAAVASGICAVGHGTDIAGSIRYPAYACGLHGLRPSIGRIAAYNASAPERFIGGQVMAVSGPIARRIEDIKIGLQAMAAPDPRDPWYVPVAFDQGAYSKRAALCLTPDGMAVTPEVLTALTDAAHRLEAQGWQVEEIDCPPMRAAATVNAKLWMAETQISAQDLIAREGEADSQFVYAQMVKDAGDVSGDDVMEALQMRATLIREWSLFLAKFPVVICPVSGMLPFDQQQDVRSEADFEQVFEAQLTQRALAALGLPAMSVAMGQAEGKPVGVQLIAARYREDILIAAGAVIEAAGPYPDVATPV